MYKTNLDRLPARGRYYASALPDEVAQGSINHIEITSGLTDSYRERFILTPTTDSVTLQVIVEPTLSPSRLRRMNWTEAGNFTFNIGYPHYWLLPHCLRSIEAGIAEHALGYTRREANRLRTAPPFAPIGPWELLPPADGYDLTRRAQRTMDKPQEPLTDLAVKLVIEQTRLRSPIKLSVNYER